MKPIFLIAITQLTLLITLSACSGYAPPEEVFRKYWIAETLSDSPASLLPFQSQEHIDEWNKLTVSEKNTHNLLWHANEQWKQQSLRLRKKTVNGIQATLLYEIEGTPEYYRQIDMVKEVGNGGWKVLSDKQVFMEVSKSNLLKLKQSMPLQSLSVSELPKKKL